MENAQYQGMDKSALGFCLPLSGSCRFQLRHYVRPPLPPAPDCPPTMGGPRINQSLADSVRAVSLPPTYWRISGRMPGRTLAG
jgi:hypothetical protein